MLYFLYNTALYLSTPFLLFSLLVRSLRARDYRYRILERFGLLPREIKSGYIWVHSVSVGETVAAAPLVKEILRQHPGKKLLVTTMTPTGSEQVRRSFGDSVDHVYAPYDLPGVVRRFLNRTQPSLLLIIETELWPNVLKQCAQRGIPAVLLNARLSEASANGYARVPSITRAMLSGLTAVAVQNAIDGQRFTRLGLEESKLDVTGSIKFDYTIEQSVEEATKVLRTEWQGASKRPIWIAASTHQGEDEIVLAAHQKLLAQGLAALLVLVPRHPERFGEVYRLCRDAGLEVTRRSAGEQVIGSTQVVLGDTMGELAALYGACDIAFVGGSLIERGGHNPIEPAAWGLPIITGVHMFNFSEIARQLVEQGGLTLVENAEQIAQRVRSIVTDTSAHERAGQSNRTVVEANRGALQRQYELVVQYL